VARIIVLDTGPVGLLACDRRRNPEADAIHRWKAQARANGVIIVIPEIADYEVRRELIRAGATAGLGRLDAIQKEL
jgi:hypothetical protein